MVALDGDGEGGGEGGGGEIKDCMSCKVTGVLTLSGVSFYALHLRSQTSLKNPRHRMFYAAFSVGFGVLAVIRGVDPPASSFQVLDKYIK